MKSIRAYIADAIARAVHVGSAQTREDRNVDIALAALIQDDVSKIYDVVAYVEFLRGCIEPRIEIFADGLVTPTRGGRGSRTPGYPNLFYYRFDYRKTRTANWTRTWRRRFAYALLHRLSGGRIDQAFMPPLLEWPQILLSIGILTAALSLLAVRRVL